MITPIKLKKTIERRERYLKIALDFFNEIGFNSQEDLIKILNKLSREYVAKLLYALIFYQYCERIIDKKDDILRPVLLICLVDAIEEKESVLNKIKIFFKRLESKDKLYLLNKLEILIRGNRGNKGGFIRVYHDLIKRNKIWKSYKDRDVNYLQVDPKLKKIDKYIDKIADHFYRIRNQTLHESKQILFALMPDEEYNIIPSSLLLYQIRPKEKKERTRVKHILSEISFLEFRKIIKRGILKKIRR